MNKHITAILIAFISVLIVITSASFIGSRTVIEIEDTKTNVGSGFGEAPTVYVASSSVFTLTTTSQRLLASSTGPRRIAATVQPVSCTANGVGVFMRANNDVVATANTGLIAFASTTFAFSEYPNLLPPQGSVQGITAVGTCTVLVTEWKAQY